MGLSRTLLTIAVLMSYSGPIFSGLRMIPADVASKKATGERPICAVAEALGYAISDR
jgi:hypothetical protein